MSLNHSIAGIGRPRSCAGIPRGIRTDLRGFVLGPRVLELDAL